MGAIKCDWCDRYFNHNCKDCRELNTHIRQLKSDLRKLVERMLIEVVDYPPNHTNCGISQYWAGELEQIIDGGE